MNEQIIIDDIIKEFDKKEIVINKKKDLLKDEVWKYVKEDNINYILFIIY